MLLHYINPKNEQQQFNQSSIDTKQIQNDELKDSDVYASLKQRNINQIYYDNNNIDNQYDTDKLHKTRKSPPPCPPCMNLNKHNNAFEDCFDKSYKGIKFSQNYKCIAPASEQPQNCLGEFAIDSISGNIYQWKFEISYKKHLKWCVIGIYGACEKSWNGVKTGGAGRHLSFYNAKDNGVGYGYNIGTDQILTEKCGNGIQGKTKTLSGDIITMRLDLTNKRLSFKRDFQDLEIAAVDIFAANSFKYRMAVKFGRRCNEHSITMLDFQVIQHQSEHTAVNIHPDKISMSPDDDDDWRQIIVKDLKAKFWVKFMRFKVRSSRNIGVIKRLIEQKNGSSFRHSKLIFGSKELHNDCIVSNFGIGNTLILYLVVSTKHKNQKVKNNSQMQLMNDEDENEYDEKLEEFDMEVETCIGNIEMENIQKCLQMQTLQLQEEIRSKNMEIKNHKISLATLVHELTKKRNNVKKELESRKAEMMVVQRKCVMHMSSCKNMQNRIEELEKEMEYQQSHESILVKENCKLKIRNEELEKNNKLMEQLLSNKDKNNECVACLDSERSYICLPCSHMCLCENCAKLVNNMCPLCQMECKDIVKVFR